MEGRDAILSYRGMMYWLLIEDCVVSHLAGLVPYCNERRKNIPGHMNLSTHPESEGNKQCDLFDLGGCGCFVEGE